jgi:flavin reductase (DIM6/NTAB) family NADH-FMN oxidoreductase RutF
MQEKSMKKSLGARLIVGATPVWIVGTYDTAGKPNIMTVAWAGICCSDPPCVAVSLRKATYSYGNIVRHGAFTINIPSADYVKEADYVGMALGKDVDKFAKMKFTPIKSDLVNAPYIQEFPLILECKLLHTIEIGLHTQFIGEILDVKAEESVLGENQTPQLEKFTQFVFSPGTVSYHKIGDYIGEAFSIGKKFEI